MVIQDERQVQHERQVSPLQHLSVAPGDDSKALINVSDSKKPSFKKHGQRIYMFCGKSGHTIDTCYRKHGVPPHLQRNSSP